MVPNNSWSINTFSFRRCEGKNIASKDILKLIKLIKLLWLQLHYQFQPQGGRNGIISLSWFL